MAHFPCKIQYTGIYHVNVKIQSTTKKGTPSAASHRSAASLSMLYAMGLISHYGQQGHNGKEEMMKQRTKNNEIMCF